MQSFPVSRLSCAALAVILAWPAHAQVAAAPPLAVQLEQLRAQLEEQRALIDKLSKELNQLQGASEQQLAKERGAGQARPAAPPATPPAPAPQVAARPAPAPRKPEPVGQPPRRDSRPPEVAPLFEQPGILTQRGKYIVEPSIQYGYSSNNRVALVGYTVIPALLIGLIDVREVKRNTTTGSVALRTGLTNRMEVEARLPYVYRSDSTVSRELFTGTAPKLVVMGIRGGDAQSDDLIGTTTAGVIFNARVPVLAIPEKTPENWLENFQRIAYATNFESNDFVAIDRLMKIIAPFNTKVLCLHVDMGNNTKVDEAMLEGMKEALCEKYPQATFECHLVRSHKFPEAVDQFIKEQQIDVLALTTHRRNLLTRLFNPGITRKMVMHTHTPLLIFHA